MYHHIHVHGDVGSGKSTVIRHVAERLQELGHHLLMTETPIRLGPDQTVATAAVSPSCAWLITEGSRPDKHATNVCIPPGSGALYGDKERLLALAWPTFEALASADDLAMTLGSAQGPVSHSRL